MVQTAYHHRTNGALTNCDTFNTMYYIHTCIYIWYTYLALSQIIIQLLRHYISAILTILYTYMCVCVYIVLFWRPPVLFKSAGADSLIRLRLAAAAEGVLTYRVNVVLLTVFVYKDYMVVIRLHVRIHTIIYNVYVQIIAKGLCSERPRRETAKFDLRDAHTHTHRRIIYNLLL